MPPTNVDKQYLNVKHFYCHSKMSYKTIDAKLKVAIETPELKLVIIQDL